MVGTGHRADIGGVAYFGVVTESTMIPGTPFAGRASIRKFTRDQGRFNFEDAWWDGGLAYELVVVSGVITARNASGQVVDVYAGTV